MSEAYLRGVSREQHLLLPESVEEYVPANCLVRVVDAFVEGLSTGDEAASLPPMREMDGQGGRKGYSPRTYAKLLIWGYVNRVHSTRGLEREAGRNLELIWLLQKLQPDHSSISRFQRANGKRIKRWLKEFNLICVSLDLMDGEEVSVDGVFLKAVNSKKNNHTQGKLKSKLERLSERIEDYLEKLEQSEQGESSQECELSAEELRAKLEEFEQAKAKAKGMLEAAEQSPTGQLSTVDEDSRLLKKKHGDGNGIVGYLAQAAVDSKAHLIAAVEVTREGNDSGQLSPMAAAAQEVISAGKGVQEHPEQLPRRPRVLADGGYFNITDLARCEEAGWDPFVPSYPQRKADAQAGLFASSEFHYDEQKDCYRCPRGEELPRHSDYHCGDSVYQTYYNTAACRRCPLRGECTKGKYRKIHRHRHQATVERMQQRREQNPEIYGNRAATVEHPFGSMMFWNHGRNLRCRGLQNANAEFSLSALAYNIKRAANAIGIEKLLAAVRRFSLPILYRGRVEDRQHRSKTRSYFLRPGNGQI